MATPLVEPMVAAVVLLLLHSPPEDASVRVIVWPAHTAPGPAIAATVGRIYSPSAQVVALRPLYEQVIVHR